MTWINRHLHILVTFAQVLAAIRSYAAEAERSRLAQAEKTGEALEQTISAAENWDKHLATTKAQARRLGGREGRGFAEIEAGIELAVDDGLRDVRRG